jgi:hypothetical protein
MPTNEEFEELKGRIVELENQLSARPLQRDVTQVSEDEMRAFVKVRDVIAGDFGGFCGINDCFRCIVMRCWQPCITRCIQTCIYECTCGPCLQNPGDIGAVSRFSGLGG